MASDTVAPVESYHFECPVCGFDDDEAGALAPEHAIYCGMCAGDNGRDVRLRRWKAKLLPAQEP